MKRTGMIEVVVAVVGGLALLCVSCGGIDDGSATNASDTQTTSDALARRTRHSRSTAPPPPPKSTGSNASAGTARAPAAPGSSPAQTIAAAQTPDGQAIPQRSGPNGECPAVVVLLGFWSCPTIGDSCAFQGGGATHDCFCSRTDGEGQNPTWVCD